MARATTPAQKGFRNARFEVFIWPNELDCKLCDVSGAVSELEFSGKVTATVPKHSLLRPHPIMDPISKVQSLTLSDVNGQNQHII